MYKVIECEQGSPEWFKARAGVITASCFDKIITPTGQKSKQFEKHVFTLVADLLAGDKASGGFAGNFYTDRGTELEPEAALMYETLRSIETKEVGFCLSDEGYYGCSPDRLVGDDGLLEIKCPAPHTHAEYIINGKMNNSYIPQVQGQLLVTGRKWCDWMSFHPDMPSLIVRIERDEEYIEKLKCYLIAARELLEDKKQQLKQLGYL